MGGFSIWKDPRIWWSGGYGDIANPTLLEKRASYNIAKDAPLPDPVPPIPQPFLRWNQNEYGGHEFVNDYWKEEYEKNPLMDHLVFTIELVFGDDKVLFVSDKEIRTKSGRTGTEYGYLSVLMDNVSFKLEAGFGQTTSKARTFKVTIPNEYLDAIGIVKAERMLAGYAEISLQVDGGDYDKRFVIMRGSMDSGVNFGNTDGETVSVTIVDPKSIMSGSLPPYRVPEAYPPPDNSGEARQPFIFTPWTNWYDIPSPLIPIQYFDFRLDSEPYKSTCKSYGAYNGQAYPPAAGVGRTYPIVWGFYDRVPCVPLVRDPHAVASEFGGPVDDAYKEVKGSDDYCDFNCFYAIAYGHGHKFEMALPGYLTEDYLESLYDGVVSSESRAKDLRVFLTIPEIRELAEHKMRFLAGGDSPDAEAPTIVGSVESTYEYGHGTTLTPEDETGTHVFKFYDGGELRHSQGFHALDAGGWEATPWAVFPCILMETFDPEGVPITIMRMSPQDGTDYNSSITIPMISSLGNFHAGGESGGYSSNGNIISCINYFSSAFTTLGPIMLDEQLFANAESKLSEMIVSGLVNGSGQSSQAQTISFIEGQLLKPFPMVSMMFTGRGYGPVVFDRRNNINGEYVVGQNMFIDRISNIVETPKTKMFNDFTMRYDYDFDDGKYRGVTTRNSGNNIACKISEEEAGRRTSSPVDSLWVYDRSVAEYCIDWRCAHQTLPSYKVTYLSEKWMIFRHSIGDNIKITDPKLDLEDVTATILSIKYRPEGCEVTLILWLYYTTLDGGATNFPLPTLETEGVVLIPVEDDDPQGGRRTSSTAIDPNDT